VGRAMADFETTGKVHYFSLESVRVRTYFSGNANWGAFQSYCERNGLRLEKHADAYDFRDEVKGFGGDPSALAVTFEEGDACTSVEDAELGSIDIHYRRRDGAFLAVWRGKGEA